MGGQKNNLRNEQILKCKKLWGGQKKMYNNQTQIKKIKKIF